MGGGGGGGDSPALGSAAPTPARVTAAGRGPGAGVTSRVQEGGTARACARGGVPERGAVGAVLGWGRAGGGFSD